jgi:hypothetical protein
MSTANRLINNGWICNFEIYCLISGFGNKYNLTGIIILEINAGLMQFPTHCFPFPNLTNNFFQILSCKTFLILY